MTQVDTRARVAGSLLALFFVAACGSEKTTEETDIGTLPTTPKILNFEASPSNVLPGEATTLAWSTRDAVAIAISDDAGRPVSVDGLDVASGSVTVSPTETTSYTLTASGPEGTPGPAYRTVTVTVDTAGVDAPTIESFTASPAAVTVGSEVTLSWSTTNAKTLTLKDDAGKAIDLGGASLANGSVTVRPERSPTVYTLIATGAGQRATAEVSVDVLGLPRIHRFFVQPIEPVVAGSKIALIWETSRADRVVVKDDAGTVVFDTTTELSGRYELPLSRTTEYTLTATGNGNAATAKVLARVGADIGEFNASPRVARAGDPIVLTWRTGGADSLVITGPGSFRHEIPAAEMAQGSTTTNLPASGDYVLSARLGTVVQTWAVYVEATEAPRIRSVSTSAAVITAAPDFPNTVALTFTQDGGTTCFVFRNGEVVPAFNGFACGQTQTIEVELVGSADLRLVATNHAGNHQATVHVDAVDPARIVSFTKTPARRLSPGGTVELAWEVTDATVVRMEKDLAPAVTIGATEFVGTRTDTVQQTTVYSLVAENSLGHRTVSALTVRAGAPEILTFASAVPVVVPGDNVTFEWTCDGGDELSLTDSTGTEAKTTTVLAEIDEGAATFPAPEVPGAYTYTLRIENLAGQEDTATFELLVTDGPLIRTFTASTTQLSLGGTVDLAWTVTDDANGTPPALTLADNLGNEYDLTGLDVNGATLSVKPTEQGSYVFTLTATTEGTRVSTAQVAVEVAAAPKIVSFEANPASLSTEGATGPLEVTLSWKTENGVSLSIFEADADGVAVPPALFRRSLAAGEPQAEIDEFSTVFHPQGTTRYLLRLTNAIGTTVDQLIRVVVDPVEILSFEPNPTDIILGEMATLSWATKNATLVAIQPPEPIVTEIPNQFVDISTDPRAEEVPMNTANDSYSVVQFPPDFRFPFDGKTNAGMRVSQNGFISFDLTSTGAAGANQALPTNQTYVYAHLMPWWDSLQQYTSGKLYTLYDDVARTMTVMWKNWSYRTTSAAFDFNFEVILHENGNFEYRYGTMVSTGAATYQNYAACSTCTIGYQDTTASYGFEIRRNLKFDEGASNLGWFFEIATPVNGTKRVAPKGNRTYTLTASNPDGAKVAKTDVKVWPVPSVDTASVYPSGPQAGLPYSISWRTSSATRVRVLDAQGAILCEETDAARVAMGSCELTEETPGSRAYTVEIINGIERNKVVRPLNFSIFPRLSVDSFTVTKNFITKGEQITLAWAGHGGFEAELLECVPKTSRTVCTSIDIRSQDPNGGSYTTNLTQSKEYWFRLVDRMYRAEEASANVWVDIPTINSFGASATQTVSGENVTFTWNTDASTTSLTNYPMGQLIETSSLFEDIATTGEVLPRTSGDADDGIYLLNFPENFRFPYFGKSYGAAQVRTDGWLQFDLNDTTHEPTNSSLPGTSYKNMHIGPFWDDLSAKQTGGAIHYKIETAANGVRALIIQWTHFEFTSATYNPADLNFQAVLFETGNIEFRYGSMTSSTSKPGAANGEWATMGLHDPYATVGAMINGQYNKIVAGGLSNRSWGINLAPAPSGATTLKPTESTTYRLCANNQSLYEVCEEIRVVVVAPGDLMISELMAAPTDAEGEWFEVRNISPDPIDLAGFQIVSGSTETYAVPAGQPAVIPPGGFGVLARSGDPAKNGGLTPMVVYGNGIDLADSSDDLSLTFMNVTIDRVLWSSAWPIQANKSLVFEPSKFDRSEGANNVAASWCVAPAVYGGGFSGNPGELGPGCLNTGAFQHYLLDPASGMPFIDIALTGTALNDLWLEPYYTVTPVPIGFPFRYFGEVVTEMTVTKYGALALAPPVGVIATSNTEIPNAANLPNGLVGPMWDTIHNAGTASVVYQLVDVGGTSVMVVQWNDASISATNGLYGLATFQAQLWENGDIVFAYREPTKSEDPTYKTYTYIYGSGATIGIENIAGDLAIQAYYGTASTGPRPAYGGRAYHFHAK